GRPGGVFHSGFELRAELFEPRVGVRVRRSNRREEALINSRVRTSDFGLLKMSLLTSAATQLFQRRDARRHRQRIAAQRARLINRSQRSEAVQNVRPTAERAHGQTAANDFSKTTQI